MSICEIWKFKEQLPSNGKSYSSLTGKKKKKKKKKNGGKEYNHVLKVWNKSEMKTMKNYHNLYLKCDVLILADAFEKFRNNS